MAALHGRTIGSFIREFTLFPANADIGTLSVRDIVERLREFFFGQYRSYAELIHGLPFGQISPNLKGTLGFVVGGFSAGAFQSELWEIIIPQHEIPNSSRQIYAPGQFGYAWFASSIPIQRYLKGIDLGLLDRLDGVFITQVVQFATAQLGLRRIVEAATGSGSGQQLVW